ncbi:hypothetical protein HDV05_005975 [Chytridiales sp. JEL 0842]|nr:hypothetical protein HDV05_005975 [Chytridiales sp. JEL 0842]
MDLSDTTPLRNLMNGNDDNENSTMDMQLENDDMETSPAWDMESLPTSTSASSSYLTTLELTSRISQRPLAIGDSSSSSLSSSASSCASSVASSEHSFLQSLAALRSSYEAEVDVATPPKRLYSATQFALGCKALFSTQTTTDANELLAAEKCALRYFLKAQSSLLPMTLAILGFYNEFGMGGLDANFKEAESLYTEAAFHGCGLAQARLAFLKTHGRPNIKINHLEAERWKKACKSHGAASLTWLHSAASANVAPAQFCLALCYYNGIAIAPNDTQAFYWCESAAKLGHPGAQNVLGNLYIEGSGCNMDAQMGLRWYIKAAEKKEPAAIYNIGTLFERGLAVDEDPLQAFEWYVRASIFGSVNAQNVLGIFHEQGLGVPQHPVRAVHYYRLAALNGHPHAQYNLGRCYHDGFGVAADDSLAVMWFKLGAEQGHALSLLSMGVCCEGGIGVQRSMKMATDYYKSACMKDSAEARKRLIPIVASEVFIASRVLLLGQQQKPLLKIMASSSSSMIPTPPTSPNPYNRSSKIPTTTTRTLNVLDLPTEILQHILTFLDPMRILTPAQLRTTMMIASDRRSLTDGSLKGGIGSLGVMVGIKPLVKECECEVGGCNKIKHFISMLEETVSEDNAAEVEVNPL